MRSEIYPFEHKKLVDLLFIFPDESAMDVQRRPAFNGVYQWRARIHRCGQETQAWRFLSLSMPIV